MNGAIIGELAVCAADTPPAALTVLLASLARLLGELGTLRLRAQRAERTRNQAHQALHATENRFRTLVEQLDEGLVVVDLDGRITFVNPHMGNLLGRAPSDLAGHLLTEFLVDEELVGFLERLERRKQGISERYELTFRTHSGTPLPCAISGTPLLDEGQRIVGAFALITDISERRRTMEALRRSEAEFRSVFENMQDVFYRSDDEGRILMVSPSGLRLLGYDSEAEVLGQRVADLWYLDPAERERFLHALKATGSVTGYEVWLRKKDGTPVLVSTSSHHDIIYAYRPDGTVSFASERVRLLGYEPDEVVGLPLLAFVHPDDRGRAKDLLRRVLAEGGNGRIECRLQRKDGTYEWCEEQSEPFLEQGKVVEVHGVIRIVTARREAEEALRASEQRYRTLLEAQGEGVGYVDDQETFLFVNPAAEAIFGLPPGTLVGMNLADFTTADEFEKVRSQTALHRSGMNNSYELQIQRPDGQQRTLLVTATPHAGFDDQRQGILGIFRDITEWRAAEASLRRLSSAIAQASDAILIADTEGIILYANPAAESLAGFEPGGLLGSGLRRFIGEEHLRPTYVDLWQKVLKGTTWSGRVKVRRNDGTWRETLTNLSPVRDERGSIPFVITDSRDVTRELELEAQLRHSQRLEAIGILAGGIAHDFNNILTPILGYAELAQLNLEEGTRPWDYVGEILSAGRRAAALVEQILTFSRQGEQDRQPIHLTSVVKEALKLLRAALPSTITIEANLDGVDGTVLADPSQLHQVVVNLCTNAFHAMRETGGELAVRLQDIHLEELRTLLGTPLPPGPYLRMEVADTGCGMDEETRKRAFRPFFTTKKVGEGTGLGLSIVHGIITSLGGAIDLQSAPGEGTTFTLYLPAHRAESRETPRKPSALPMGQERILVVDDEVMVGAMLRDMLSELGYQVAVLDSPVDALRTLTMAPEHWDLVLSDMTMPELTGLELAGHMRRQGIPVPVILMTGYSETLNGPLAQDSGVVAVLHKPVPLPALTRLIRDTLDRVSAT